MPEFHEPQFYILIFLAISVSALTIYSVATARGFGKFLCQDCKFNNSADCLKDERPMAFECTSYRKKETSSKISLTNLIKKIKLR